MSIDALRDLIPAYAKEQGEFDVAFAIAAILMALALLINLTAMLTGRYFKKRRSL